MLGAGPADPTALGQQLRLKAVRPAARRAGATAGAAAITTASRCWFSAFPLHITHPSHPKCLPALIYVMTLTGGVT